MKYEIRTSILILILSLVFITVILPSKRVQKETKENFSSGNNQIFVSIASYRDRECDRTIHSIYRQAANPNNVYVGICQQNNEDEDKDCYENLPSFVPKGNVSIMRLPHFDAKGPTHARYLCSKLWNNQEFYLQIDSHTQFLKDWDKNLISCINECGGEKSVISYFPPAEYNNDDSLEKNGDDKPTEPPSNYNGKIPYTCDARINDKGIVRALSANPINPPKRCMRIPHLAAGMLFLNSNFLKTVPFDPWLPYVFEGEEMLLSARLWTNGYNFYMPNENICLHLYADNKDKNYKRPLYWEDINGSAIEHLKKSAVQRVRYLLGRIKLEEVPMEVRPHLDKYGMGTERSLDEFYKFIGVDFENNKVERYCDKMYDENKKEWVPINNN